MNRLNHHHLYLFWVFGKTENFTKAANHLSIAQSAVTSQLKLFEENLRLELIDRSNPRYPRLTEDGFKVLDYADAIFESSQELLNWASGGGVSKNRIIRIGALSGLSRNLQFLFMQPLIGREGTKFEVCTGDQKKIVQMLKDHQLDVVLTSQNVSTEKKSFLYSHVLTRSPLVFVIKKQKNKIDFLKAIKELGVFVPGENFEAKAELDAFLKKYPAVSILGQIDDIALLRILAIKSNQIVALPEVGVVNEVKAGKIQVLKKIDNIEQRFYAITKLKRSIDKDVDFLIEKIQGQELLV
jgi:LysR family transcriptional regulator, transcriptional activator of nhaA